MAWSDWASVVVAGSVGGASLYFANSIRRRAREDLQRSVQEKRLAAYGEMWTEMESASPLKALITGSDVSQGGGSGLDRKGLFNQLTAWYYRHGNGMLLTLDTRNIYLAAKGNLVCRPDQFVPAKARAVVACDDAERDRLVVRQ